MGHPRLRGPVRPPAAGDVAAGDRRRPRDPPGPRGRRDRGHDPRPVAGRRPRGGHAPPVPRRRRRREARHGRALRRGRLRRRVLRFRRDGRCRPLRARAHRAAPGRRPLVGGRGRPAPGRDRRQRRRAVRPSPVVPRPVPRAPRRAGAGDVRSRVRRRRPRHRRRGTGRPPAPRDPDPGANVVELPSRRPALVRRVPGRPRRSLEGTAAPGAGPAGGRDRRRDGRRRRWAAGDERSGRRLGGAGRIRRRRDRGGRAGRVRRGAPGARVDGGGPPAAARAPRGAALAAGDVRVGRVVLGRSRATRDAAGAALGGAGRAPHRRDRRDVARGRARRRPRRAAVTLDGDRRRDDLPERADRGRPAPARGLAPGTSGRLPAVHGACDYRCQR